MAEKVGPCCDTLSLSVLLRVRGVVPYLPVLRNCKRALGYRQVLDLFLSSRSLSSRISFAFLKPPQYVGPDPPLVS
jgi:hypothetical protein